MRLNIYKIKVGHAENLRGGVQYSQSMKKVLFLLFLAFPFFYSKNVSAADTLLFDSTNAYLGACQLTDRSEWTLDKDLDISLFQVWYNWDANETELPVTVLYEGEDFASFTAKRASCDPYQKLWCNADFQINKTFPKGKYETKIPTKKQCLKPGGTGAIRLYGAGTATGEVVSTPTPTLTTPPTAAPIIATKESQGCSCTKTILVTAVGASLVSSLIFSLLLRRK